ncbi:hypothetical protein DFQ28_002083 [Apophysomyces sp. BC1034]|nr:hypothetical protein DFQ29_001524 [Apophysomyces sp. BC1021]KAG0190414.1 hypothetical protein DFQ28_002083 [Apophysomyces sp. BC1034]
MKSSITFVASLFFAYALAAPYHHGGLDRHDHSGEYGSRNHIVGAIDAQGSERDHHNNHIQNVENVGNRGGSSGGILNNLFAGGIGSTTDDHVQILQSSYEQH